MAQCQARERAREPKTEGERWARWKQQREKERESKEEIRKGMTGKDSWWTKQAEWTKKSTERKESWKEQWARGQRDKWMTEGDRHCLIISLVYSLFLFSSSFFVHSLHNLTQMHYYHFSAVSTHSCACTNMNNLYALGSTIQNTHTQSHCCWMKTPKSQHFSKLT